MRIASQLRLGLFLCLAFVAARAQAVQPTENLLPATTKGFVSTHDVDEVRTKFGETQLGAWVKDPAMEPFITDLKKQIAEKMEKAGKRIGVRWPDLDGVYGGEVAIALIQPDPKDKLSHATALIVDITGKKAEADALLAKIDANQKGFGAVRSSVKAAGIDMIVYTEPLAAGEKVPHKTFYFVKDAQLVAVDHLGVATDIAGRMSGAQSANLAGLEAFKYSMERNLKEADGNRHHVRWFIEPFGYAEASRAAQGGRKRRGTDMLKILQAQGFPAVQGIGGYIFFATGPEEVLHRTYVYAPAVKRDPAKPSTDKYDLAMRMLNFPNNKLLKVQDWALPDLASYLTFNMKMQDAFEYSETLVDAVAGDKGVFDEIWLSLESDPHGPRINIRKELISQLKERGTILSDVKLPVDLKSERLMAVVEIKDPAIVAKTLEKAFKADPAAKKKEYKGHIIWEISQEEGVAETSELMIEGAGFVSKEDEAVEEEEEGPMLPNMALTVFQGHLVVSTHVDYVEDLISHGGKGAKLADKTDFQRVEAELIKRGQGEDSFHYFVRTSEAYRATYELIKQNKLPESDNLLAKILNGLFGEEEGMVRSQEIDGAKLPDFSQIEKYLGPGGVFVQSEANGWYVVGNLLKK
ncbi:MAG: hypothetical protein SFU86_25725 [Pirellulaceae bacterium]|nr:hypothetical protein [Pirellulaceae bacterium]